MRGRTARARPRRRAQMQRRRRQVTQTERGKNATPFNYSLAQARSHLSPPPLHPSLYLIPLLGTCFYYSGSNVARMRKGRGGRRGCPFLGNKGFVARSSFLLFPPILVLTRARTEGGREEGEHIWRGERGRAPSSPHHPSIFSRFSNFSFPLTTGSILLPSRSSHGRGKIFPKLSCRCFTISCVPEGFLTCAMPCLESKYGCNAARHPTKSSQNGAAYVFPTMRDCWWHC